LLVDIGITLLHATKLVIPCFPPEADPSFGGDTGSRKIFKGLDARVKHENDKH